MRRRQVRIVGKRDRALAAPGEVVGAGEGERDAVLAVAADQRELRARGLDGRVEELRAAADLRTLAEQRRAARADAGCDVEVVAGRRDRDPGPAVRAEALVGGDDRRALGTGRPIRRGGLLWRW